MSILPIQQCYKYWIRYAFQWRDIHTGIGVTWRCKGKQLTKHSNIFLHKNNFLMETELKRKNRSYVQSGGKGCIDIKDRFKPISPLFIPWLIRKFNFVTPVVDFCPPPIAVTKLRLCTKCCRNVFSTSYTSKENGHTYCHHDPKTQLKVATSKAGNVLINVTLRRVPAPLLVWKSSNTYSKCVSVALVIQHVMRILHNFIYGLSVSKIRFHIIS